MDSRNEPSETRVAVSEAGVELPKVLLSKTIVGLVAEVALADEEIDVRPARARRVLSEIAVILFDTEDPAEIRKVDIVFPSIKRCMMLKLTLDP